MKPTEKEVNELLTRGISAVYPSKDSLKEALLSGKRLSFYLGADPTGPELHLGHSTNLILIEKLRRLGHKTIVLFGDFTAKIGDPTGKENTRRQMTEKEIKTNIKTWKSQISRIVSFEDKENPAEILLNSKWLSKLKFTDVLELSSHVTVKQMIERDMFEERVKAGKPIYLHEFFYPLMQGYDSVAMDIDGEIGGNDQTFNMLMGRMLLRQYKNKEKFVITTTLLVNQKTGKKLMNKSEGDYIPLTAGFEDMYGKVMALPDEVILQVLTDCTFLPLEEIEKVKIMLHEGSNPKEVKMRLGREIVTLYHDAKKAAAAEKKFTEVFKKGGMPDEVRIVKLKKEEMLADILVREKLVSSKTEFRRLLSNGAISINGETANENSSLQITKDADIKIGKHRFLKIKS
ncbi:MAG: tyrosine--tRNA ligase [bacterium]|nr:tyrosine--tRNA ligase [bacterium]